MKVSSILKFGHESMLKYVHKSAVVIDATIGNGNDTYFLKQAHPKIKVYGFDIQSDAINNAKIKNELFKNISYINDSHEHICNYVNDSIDLAIFNLGYLPNSESKTTTAYKSTITALTCCLRLLKPKAAVVLTIYTEHDNHEEEKNVIKYIRSLNKYEYNIIKYEFMNLNECPYVIVIEKK